MLFFLKKFEIFQIQNFTKIPSFTIFFHFFTIFDIFFSISPIQSCQKIMEFLVLFYWKDQRFYQRILKISRSSFKKLLICEIIFFFQNFAVFYFFLLFLTFCFLFHPCVLAKNSGNFDVVLFYGLEILSKNVGKSWNSFLKKYRHFKSKILHKFHCLLFLFLAFLIFFFLFHLSKLV